MVISVSRQEDEATLAWLKEELGRADNRGQPKLADLLVAVQDDISAGSFHHGHSATLRSLVPPPKVYSPECLEGVFSEVCARQLQLTQ